MLIDAVIASSVMGLFLILGYLVVRLPLLRRAFLPGSLIAGIILLVLGPQILGVQTPHLQLPVAYYDFWKSLPKQLINVVFACLFLARPISPLRKMWKLAGPQVAFGQMLAWGQYMLGGILTLFILTPFFNVNPVAAALIEISFEGGHGTAAGLGPVFSKVGFAEGQELALGLATVSLCTALISGVILVNWGRRRHHIKSIHTQTARQRSYHRRIVYELHKQGITLTEHMTPSRIVSHLLLIGVSILFGWLLYSGLILVEQTTWAASNSELRMLQYVPFFPLCMFGGMLAHLLWKKMGILVSRQLVELLSGIALSVLIASAVATMTLNYISSHIVVFLLLAFTGIVWILFGFVVLAKRMFKKGWFQNGIVNTGQSMGMTATGLLFLHMVDPEDKTNSMESFGYKQLMFEPFVGGGIVTALSMPFILQVGLVPFTIISSVICLFWMLLGLLYFGK